MLGLVGRRGVRVGHKREGELKSKLGPNPNPKSNPNYNLISG